MLTLGSLFDGSGGFPLAGVINGIIPLWASEIEPFPLRVTAKRFPSMKQLGDITKINGDEIDHVDIITFGSPCQDLSLAGKRAGIHEGTRSSLFFEAIRIIKEMREATDGKYPRYAIWENVKGAFSSNQREDFAAVLQALGSIREDNISIPVPKKWQNAGYLVGNGWSIAWRLYDAQYWGVPQRRKRIYLVADFAGERADKILFESESLPGNPEQSEGEREDSARDTSESPGETSQGCLNPWDVQSEHIQPESGISEPLYAGECRYGGGESYVLSFQERAENQPIVLESNQNHATVSEDGVCNTLPASMGMGGGYVPMITQQAKAVDQYNGAIEDKQSTLGVNRGTSTGRNAVLYEMQHASDVIRENEGTAPTLQHRMGTGGNNVPLTIQEDTDLYIVRRLTPLECCRLQGFPDWWDADVEGTDSARYKMWGNGIALPCAVDVLKRVKKGAERQND